MTVGVPEVVACSLFWVSTRPFFSTPVPFIFLLARAGTTTAFYLDTPYIPFVFLSSSSHFPVLDYGSE